MEKIDFQAISLAALPTIFDTSLVTYNADSGGVMKCSQFTEWHFTICYHPINRHLMSSQIYTGIKSRKNGRLFEPESRGQSRLVGRLRTWSRYLQLSARECWSTLFTCGAVTIFTRITLTDFISHLVQWRNGTKGIKVAAHRSTCESILVSNRGLQHSRRETR